MHFTHAGRGITPCWSPLGISSLWIRTAENSECTNQWHSCFRRKKGGGHQFVCVFSLVVPLKNSQNLLKPKVYVENSFRIVRWKTKFTTHLSSWIRHVQGVFEKVLLLPTFCNFSLFSSRSKLPSARHLYLFLSHDLHLSFHTIILPFILSFLHFTSSHLYWRLLVSKTISLAYVRRLTENKQFGEGFSQQSKVCLKQSLP